MTPAERKSEVERHIKEMVEEGTELTGRGIMRRMGLTDDRTIRKDWDELAIEGRVPVRPGPGAYDYAGNRVARWRERQYASSGVPAGKMLVDVEQRYRAFIERIRVADEMHKTNEATRWLGEQLNLIAQLHEEAVREVYGRSVDHLIEEFQISLDKQEGFL